MTKFTDEAVEAGGYFKRAWLWCIRHPKTMTVTAMVLIALMIWAWAV